MIYVARAWCGCMRAMADAATVDARRERHPVKGWLRAEGLSPGDLRVEILDGIVIDNPYCPTHRGAPCG